MNIQLIDEFRRRTNASYDEAKYYLERHNGDLLEAIISFEKERTGYQNQGNPEWNPGNAQRRPSGFGRGLVRLIQRLFDIKLVITDKNMRTFPIPIIILIVLSPVWHIMVIAALIMLMMGFRFGFQEMVDQNVNVEAIVEKVKAKVKEGTKCC